MCDTVWTGLEALLCFVLSGSQCVAKSDVRLLLLLFPTGERKKKVFPRGVCVSSVACARRAGGRIKNLFMQAFGSDSHPQLGIYEKVGPAIDICLVL
ncbi:hypothetical protein CEXT_112151 [Caerostris extrusa]|uniref:Secreted protein n=1 Tax=Caerostris extrusa TaxID=172846 RepID=A0AAV4NG63_CAEEX|nr:hypothetical protein CEXT_112151 [Caerostris extrusa]